MADIRNIKIDGVDIEAAIAIIEDEDVLEAMMKTWCEDGDDKLLLIEKALEEKDIANYSVYVHALKSSSKSIGALDLSERFKALELAGKSFDADFIEKNNDSTIAEFKRILGELKNCFGEEKDEQVEFGEEEAAPLLDAIRAHDMDGALVLIEDLSEKGYSDYVNGNLEDIKTAVEIKDFDDAAAILEDVLLTIEVSGL